MTHVRKYEDFHFHGNHNYEGFKDLLRFLQSYFRRKSVGVLHVYCKNPKMAGGDSKIGNWLAVLLHKNSREISKLALTCEDLEDESARLSTQWLTHFGPYGPLKRH